MARLALAVACCVLAAGTAAKAQVTSVTGASTSTVQLDGTFQFTMPGIKSQGTNGSAFYSSFSTTPSIISFESANASHGTNVHTISTSSVDIMIQNGGAAAVNPVLQSQITGAGLGLYLANTAGPCGGSGLFAGGDPFGGCAQTTSGLTFQDLSPFGSIGETVAGAAFEFKVTADGATVYDFTGFETLTLGDGGLVLSGLQLSAPGVLQNLTHTQPGMPGSADSYLWDASDVSIALGGALAPGATRDIVYSSTVSTFSIAGCTTSDASVCLVPYAAFGDPIGTASGALSPAFAAGPQFTTDFAPPSDGIPFVDDWAPQTFRVPTFDFGTGVLTFNSGVPEPKTWMSLILGFGLLGAALRRRRVLGYT